MKILLVLIIVLSMTACSTTHRSGNSRLQDSAKIHTELAALYYERGQLGVALDELKKALSAEPNYAPAFNVRGLVHMFLHENIEAKEDFLHSLKLDVNDSNTNNNYGWFLCQNGHERESVKHFLAAIKNPLYRTPEKALLNAGICSKKAGDMQEAEGFVQKALLLRPTMPEAQLEMAKLNFTKHDYIAAKSNFSQFAKNTNLTAENLWLALRIERKLGDQSAVESYALQLRKRFPDSRETQLMLQER